MSDTRSTDEMRFAIQSALPLFLLRLTVGLFFLQWGLEKFFAADVTTKIFAHFYKIPLPVSFAPVLGAVEVLLAVAILAGFQRRIAFGLAFLIHLGSTVSTWQNLIDPYGSGNHLFMTGVPVLAAIFLLYRLREYNTMFSVGGS